MHFLAKIMHSNVILWYQFNKIYYLIHCIPEHSAKTSIPNDLSLLGESGDLCGILLQKLFQITRSHLFSISEQLLKRCTSDCLDKPILRRLSSFCFFVHTEYDIVKIRKKIVSCVWLEIHDVQDSFKNYSGYFSYSQIGWCETWKKHFDMHRMLCGYLFC